MFNKSQQQLSHLVMCVGPEARLNASYKFITP